jgi:hypothetical protein
MTDKAISMAEFNGDNPDNQRNFAEEQSEMIRELVEMGLPNQEATAAAREVMLCDWLVYKAQMTIGRWHDEECHASEVVKLVEIMRRGIADKRGGDY